jgi:hypothetical protein
MKPRARLTPAIFALALLSAAPALPQSHRGAAPRSTSLAAAERGFLPDFLVRLWGDSGCVIDPFGGTCRPAATPSTTARPRVTSLRRDLGCEIDPFGRCRQAAVPAANAVTGDLGCSADPFGGHCGNAATSPSRSQ